MVRSSLKKLGIIACLCFAVSPLANSVANAQEVFRICGSTVMQPLTDAVAAAYQKKYGETIKVDGGGSDVGLKEAIAGTTTIGAYAKKISEEVKTQIKNTTVAYDGIVIIVNEQNPVTNLTKQNLIDMYTEKVKNWKEVGGPDMPIALVTRVYGAPMDLFTKYTGLTNSGSKEPGVNGMIANSAIRIETNFDLVQSIGDIPNSIGFASYGTALSFKEKGIPLKIISLDGFVPSKEAILANKYPITTEFNYVYKEHSDKIDKFLQIFNTPEGKKIVEDEGSIVP